MADLSGNFVLAPLLRHRYDSKMRQAARYILLLSALVGARPAVAARLDQLIGIRTSQAISQKILGNPPLPNLEETGTRHLTPMVSYLDVDIDESGGSGGVPYDGKMEGFSGGIGYTQSSKQNLSYYGFLTMNRVTGDINVKFGGDGNFYLKNIINSAYNLSLGLSYRLWSEKTFPLVIGLLGGPYFSLYKSGYRTDVGNYDASTAVFGPMAGIQMRLKVWKLIFNPFYLRYFDFSNQCKSYNTTAPAANDGVSDESANGCSRINKQIRLRGDFFSYGLNLTAYGITLGVYSAVQKTRRLTSTKIHNYVISYTFDF